MTIKQILRPVEVKVIMKLYLKDCCYSAVHYCCDVSKKWDNWTNIWTHH